MTIGAVAECRPYLATPSTARPIAPMASTNHGRQNREFQGPAAITNAVAAGDLTPGEAADLSQLVANYAKALEVVDLAERVSRLEETSATP